MTSKHDLLTGVITIVVIAASFGLVVTHNLTGQIETAVVAGLGMIFTYWFTRGGSMISMDSTTPAPVDTQAIAQAVVNQLGQTPAKVATDTNAGHVTGSGGN